MQVQVLMRGKEEKRREKGKKEQKSHQYLQAVGRYAGVGTYGEKRRISEKNGEFLSFERKTKNFSLANEREKRRKKEKNIICTYGQGGDTRVRRLAVLRPPTRDVPRS